MAGRGKVGGGGGGGGGDKLAGGRAHPAAAGRPALFSAYVGLSKVKRPYLYQRRATGFSTLLPLPCSRCDSQGF